MRRCNPPRDKSRLEAGVDKNGMSLTKCTGMAGMKTLPDALGLQGVDKDCAERL